MSTLEQPKAAATETESRYFDPLEIAPRAELRRIQQERLLAQLAYVGERSPLIRKVWAEAGVDPAGITSIDDFLARAPFIDKDSLRQWRDTTGDAFGGVVCAPPTEVDLIGTSSGTTGDPTFFAES